MKVPGAQNHHLYSRQNRAGETVYEVGWRDRTRKLHWKSVGTSIQGARAERDRILGALAGGGNPQANPRLTYGQAADAWLAALDARDLRPKTKRKYRDAERLHLRPRFDAVRLDQLGVRDVTGLITAMRSKGFKPATIRVALDVLRWVYRHAASKLDWSGPNPLALLENGDRPTVEETDKRIFTADELRATLAAAREPYRTMFTLLLDTGARVSEVLGLQLDNAWLGDADPRVKFAGQLDDATGKYVAYTKTKASKGEVPISQATAERLRAHLASEHGGRTYLFETRDGTPFDRHNIGRELRRTLDRAGLRADDNGKRPSLHSFRHTCASLMIDRGASAEDVCRRLRHKNSNVTRATYVHFFHDADRRSADRSVTEGIMAEALV